MYSYTCNSNVSVLRYLLIIYLLVYSFLQAAKKAKSKQPSARKSSQKRSRKSKGDSDADESQGTLFDIVKAGKGALRVCCIVQGSR